MIVPGIMAPPPLLDFGIDFLTNLLAELVLLKQKRERLECCLIRNLIADLFDSCKAAHAGYLDQRIFHGWITEAAPLLHQVYRDHSGQLKSRRPPLWLILV